MRLLFLTPQLPHPPRQGTAIRNWGLIKSLSARHTLSLLTFAGAHESVSPELRAACAQVETIPPPQRSKLARLLQLVTSPRPDLAHRLASPAFAQRFLQLTGAQSFDAVFVEGLELAPFVFPRRGATRVVFDAHNCETMLQRRAHDTDRRAPGRWLAACYSAIQAGRLARYESAVCLEADRVTCVSAEDAAALRSLAPGMEPVVVPNGIFLEEYAAKDDGRRAADDDGGPSLVFTGKMDYRPNVDAVTWFADEVLPIIQRAIAEVRFVIVGQKPAAAVQQLAMRPGITVTGAVDDAKPYIARAAAYVAPLRMGGGTRFKLLEAFALKCPVVSTRVGAEGFAVQAGRELLLADGAAEFAEATLALLRDPAKQQALREAGYSFVQAYDWGAIIPAVEQLLSAQKPRPLG